MARTTFYSVSHTLLQVDTVVIITVVDMAVMDAVWVYLFQYIVFEFCLFGCNVLYWHLLLTSIVHVWCIVRRLWKGWCKCHHHAWMIPRLSISGLIAEFLRFSCVLTHVFFILKTRFLSPVWRLRRIRNGRECCSICTFPYELCLNFSVHSFLQKLLLTPLVYLDPSPLLGLRRLRWWIRRRLWRLWRRIRRWIRRRLWRIRQRVS